MKTSEQVTWDNSMPGQGCKLWIWWQSWIESLSWTIQAEIVPPGYMPAKAAPKPLQMPGTSRSLSVSAASTLNNTKFLMLIWTPEMLYSFLEYGSYDKMNMIFMMWCWDAPKLQELGSTRPLDASVPTSGQQRHLAPCSATPGDSKNYHQNFSSLRSATCKKCRNTETHLKSKIM